jgi:TatA/E family protein of Tat protein translocase
VVLLILESLGSTELLFILAMALVFFGPRKLPQISRSLGKNLAEFRRASEDFKSTWEREVNLEEYSLISESSTTATPLVENSIMNDDSNSQPTPAPAIEAVTAEQVVPRESAAALPLAADENLESQPGHTPGKSDWL